MASKWDILGIGTAAVDDLLLVEEFPRPESKVDILESTRQGGGQTATAMVAAARQGVKAAFCCHLGFDDLSLYTIRELEKEGVDCSPCVQSEEGNPFHSTIIVDQSQQTRTILHSGGNLCPPENVITAAMISQTRYLFIDDNSRGAGIKAARIARSLGIPVIADVEPDPPPEYMEMLPLIDHLVIGRELAAALSGKTSLSEIASGLCGKDRTCCIVTAGDEGCWYSIHGEPAMYAPGYQVGVIDTTGCGDVFHGAYAAALARGETIAQAVKLANASAALKATKLGGRLGIPDLATLQRFLADH